MKKINLLKSCNIIIQDVAAFFYAKTLYTIFVLLLLVSCKTAKLDLAADYQIKFLDEFIVESDLKLNNTIIGGLSGIDFNGQHYVLVSDSPQTPAIFKAQIDIENYKIKAIQFLERELLRCNSINRFDAEGIRFLPHQSGYLISTEGAIKFGQNPSLIEINPQGKCMRFYDLPNHFSLDYPNKPRHNGVFEGLTLDHDKQGFWIVNELPLKDDGKKPIFINTFSPVRLTHYNFESLKPDFQFSYDLERLVKIPILPFGLNGATEILQIDETHFLLIERSYSAGHGTKGNRVKLFLVGFSDVYSTLDLENLKKQNGNTVLKTLVFDSKKIRKQLQFQFIDNIEGMSFGPDLPNGNKSLILVSDNNFNPSEKQLNQFLLLELIKLN